MKIRKPHKCPFALPSKIRPLDRKEVAGTGAEDNVFSDTPYPTHGVRNGNWNIANIYREDCSSISID